MLNCCDRISKQILSFQDKLQSIIKELDKENKTIANLQSEKFEGLSKEVKLAHEQANLKINSGFEQLQNENSIIQKNVSDKISEINTAFKDYSQKIQDSLNKFTDDNNQTKLDSNMLNAKILAELKNIIQEIKAPLDLD